MKIAFIASECVPFVKTGGLADVCGALPLALERIKVPTVIVIPYYREVNTRGFKVKQLSATVAQTVLGKSIRVYLIKSKKYFDRVGLYGSAKGDFEDNLERYQYFCEQALGVIREYEADVNIVHCHDWQASLVPVLLKTKYKKDTAFARLKCLLTIHNLAFQGIFTYQQFKQTGFDAKLFGPNGFEFYGRMNLLKAGIIFSDMITSVSKSYAAEIQTADFGCGLEGVLKQKKNKPTGIVNGIDCDIWNPAHDKHLLKKYSAKSFVSGKKTHKEYLQKKFKFEVSPNVPLFGFVGRVTHQKGADLIAEAILQFEEKDAQFVIQGLGDQSITEKLKRTMRLMKKNVATVFEFDERLAHRIYAGSDFFLMPSRFEPCGLSQMISMRYGTLPLVNQTGGLADTVVPHKKRNGTGFVMTKPSIDTLVANIEEAIKVYANSTKMKRLIVSGFNADFSWDKSAKEYKKVYACL